VSRVPSVLKFEAHAVPKGHHIRLGSVIMPNDDIRGHRPAVAKRRDGQLNSGMEDAALLATVYTPSPSVEGGKVHGAVVREIAARVLGGRYPAGSSVPREDELAAELGVSRTTIREAVKVLSAKGLIESRQRVGVRVRPRDDWRLLDPAVLSWHPNIGADHELMSGLLDARRIVEPAAAELAARRATAQDLAAMEAAYLTMERTLPFKIDACCEADVSFHQSLLRATHNFVLSGLIGMIGAALRAAFQITTELTQAQTEALHVHRDVLEAIRMRDPEGARRAMNQLLDVAEHDMGGSAMRQRQ
jgi:GntR family transcriptional regulator, galactonate operon transcriptional repressor